MTPRPRGSATLLLMAMSCPTPLRGHSDSTTGSALSDVVSIRDFGGASDDVALQAALNSISAGTVYMPEGKYTFARSVALKSGVAVIGAGIGKTVISGARLTAGNHFFTARSISDAAVFDITLKGPSAAAPPGTVDVRGVSASGCSRCRFERLSITSVSDGVDILGNSEDCVVAYNAMLKGSNQGVAVQGNHNRVEHNRIGTWGITNLHHGIYGQEGDGNQYLYNQISDVQGFCIHVFNVSPHTAISDTRIIGNYCLRGGLSSGMRGGYAFAAGAESSTAKRAAILQNTADGFSGTGLYISDASDVWATGNVFRNFKGDGILLKTVPGFAVSERINLIANDISNGTITGNGISIVSGGPAVRNLTVSRNRIDTVSGIGIWLRGVSDSVLRSNSIRDYNSQGNSSNDGIRLEFTSVRNLVETNEIATTTGYAFALHLVDSADGDNSLLGNILNQTRTISDAGAHNVKARNTSSPTRRPRGGGDPR